MAFNYFYISNMEFAEYIFNPQTLVSLIIAVGGFYAGYKVLEKRVEQLEKEVKALKDLDLDSRLTRMETDLSWIRSMMEKRKN